MTKTKTSTKPDLRLCVDCGGSATKILYQTSSSSQPSLLMMGPEVEKIEPNWLNSYFELEGALTRPAPEKEAYLTWGEETYVVGDFAHRFNPEDRIAEAKYENASYKVLAAIGVILTSSKLITKKTIKCQLALLLPWNEYKDSKILEKRLEEMLSEYEFQGQKLRVRLEKFVCKPEGFGLAMLRMREKGTDYFRESNIAVIMLGHRNSTALMLEKGAFRGESPLYGFRELLDTVVKRTSGLERDALASSIFRAIRDFQREQSRYSEPPKTSRPDFTMQEAFQKLGRAKDSKLRASEIAEVAKVLTVATQEYWVKLNRWFDKFLLPNSELREVIISGGAALYWKGELEKRFNCKLVRSRTDGCCYYYAADSSLSHAKIVFDAGIEESLKKAPWFLPKLLHRATDCYGLFDYLIKGDSK